MKIFTNIDEYISKKYWQNILDKQSLKKTATKSKEQDNYLFHQLNSIMNKSKSKFSSVDEAVEHMKKISGFSDYLEKTSKENSYENENLKSEAQVSNEPTLFTKYPQIKKTIENVISTTRGNISIPAILSKVADIYKRDVPNSSEWEDAKLFEFIRKLNLEAKTLYPSYHGYEGNLGFESSDNQVSPENEDAFYHLLPAHEQNR